MKTRLSNWTRLALPVLLVGGLAVACGDDDEATGITTADLAGNWTANSFVVANNDFLPVDPFDIVGVGVLVSLNIQASGAFTFTTLGLDDASGGLLSDIDITGTFTVTGNNTADILVSTGDPNDPAAATFTLSGDDLALAIPDAALIDFKGDDVITEPDELVDITSTMTR